MPRLSAARFAKVLVGRAPRATEGGDHVFDADELSDRKDASGGHLVSNPKSLQSRRYSTRLNCLLSPSSSR